MSNDVFLHELCLFAGTEKPMSQNLFFNDQLVIALRAKVKQKVCSVVCLLFSLHENMFAAHGSSIENLQTTVWRNTNVQQVETS